MLRDTNQHQLEVSPATNNIKKCQMSSIYIEIIVEAE